jgi:methyl-accepting chemotaxis protein
MEAHASEQKLQERLNSLYEQEVVRIAKRTDKLLAAIMFGQWLIAFVAVTVTSPQTWAGSQSSMHPHISDVIGYGALFTIFPVFLAYTRSGEVLTRYAMAIGQMSMGALIIHLSGGRIEYHFHVFVSLAVLSFYRDWRVLVIATIVALIDHIGLGYWLPQSVYGVSVVQPWRWLEHSVWVLLEDVFLITTCRQIEQDMKDVAKRQAALEQADKQQMTIAQLQAAEKALTEQTSSISLVVTALSDSEQRISAVLSELASNAQETLAAVTETTTIVDEVRQTAEVSSHKARKVSEDAQRVMQVSEQGKTATDDTVDGMARIREQMSAIADGMMQLSSQSKMIGEIITTVDDLAQQSNLLSVNASIEASKAGEHGKGFSVVAQEVKNLSRESKEATTRVRRILNDITKASTSATLATELGNKAVASGEDVVKQAKQAIMALSESIIQASQTSTQIEVSSQQQLVGMQQVVAAMDSVKEASNHNVKSVRELEQAVHDLNELGKRLRNILNQNGHNGNPGNPEWTMTKNPPQHLLK